MPNATIGPTDKDFLNQILASAWPAIEDDIVLTKLPSPDGKILECNLRNCLAPEFTQFERSPDAKQLSVALNVPGKDGCDLYFEGLIGGNNTRIKVKNLQFKIAVKIDMNGFDDETSGHLGPTLPKILEFKASGSAAVNGHTVDIKDLTKFKLGPIEIDLADDGAVKVMGQAVIPGNPIIQALVLAARNNGTTIFPPISGAGDDQIKPEAPPVDPIHLDNLASSFSSKIRDISFNPFDCIGDLNVASGGRKLAGFEDSAIWSGHFLAAEAFRFRAATDDAGRNKAREAALWGLERIRRIMQIPGKAIQGEPGKPELRDAFPSILLQHVGMPGRVAVPADQVQNLDWNNSFWYAYPSITAQDDDDANIWLFGLDRQGPSRDQILGLAFGLSVAFKTPSLFDQNNQNLAADLLYDLVSWLNIHSWNIQSPNFPDQPAGSPRRTRVDPPVFARFRDSFAHFFCHRLALLAAGSACESYLGLTSTTLRDSYKESVGNIGDAVWFIPWIEAFSPQAGYFKFNVHSAAIGILASFVEETTDSSYEALRYYAQILRETTYYHQNAYFELIYLYSWPEGQRSQVLNFKSPIATSLELELRKLVDSQYLRASGTSHNQGLPSNTTLPSAVTKLTNLVGIKQPDNQHFVTLVYALPPELRCGYQLDFAWQRSPFAVHISSTGSVDAGDINLLSPGIDFSLVHWMSKALGVRSQIPDMHFMMTRALSSSPTPSFTITSDPLGTWLQNLIDFKQQLNDLNIFSSCNLLDFCGFQFSALSPDPDRKFSQIASVLANISGTREPDIILHINGNTSMKVFDLFNTYCKFALAVQEILTSPGGDVAREVQSYNYSKLRLMSIPYQGTTIAQAIIQKLSVNNELTLRLAQMPSVTELSMDDFTCFLFRGESIR